MLFFNWLGLNRETEAIWFRGSMFAKSKINAIDGRAQPGVESAAHFDSTRGNLPGPDVLKIDR